MTAALTSARSLGARFGELAHGAPARPMVSCGDLTLTREQVERAANQLARAYQRLGVRPDDFVAVALPNGVELVLAVIACWKLGATPLPISRRLVAAELEAILRLAQPALVVGLDPSAAIDCAWIPAGFVGDRQLSDAPLPDQFAREWKAILSGGSTGRPKIIVDPRSGVVAPWTLNGTMRDDDTVLVAGPMHHNAGFKHCFNGLLAGCHVVMMPRFDAGTLIDLVQRHGVTWLSLVPTMMHRIWTLRESAAKPFALPTVRVVYHGGAPCADWLKLHWIEWLGPERIFEIYGGTENNGLAFISGTEWLQRRGSVGRPLPGHAFRILDDAGRPLPARTRGAIHTKPEDGSAPTYRYIGSPPCAQIDGWETLGDIGYFDEAGYLYVCDRETDMILRGGANIYPAEIEAALECHPAVRSSAVIGLPDDDLGNRIHAIVHADPAPTVDAMRVHLAPLLARHKQPASFEFVNVPLRDEAGKVRRSALRAARLASAI